MKRSLVPGCVGALGVIAASVAIAAGPHHSFGPETEAGSASTVIRADSAAPAPTEPAVVRAVPAAGATFTRVSGAEAEVLFGAEWPAEGGVFRVLADRAPIPCYDITINFALEPGSTVAALVRIRGYDLDGNGVIEADAGNYNLFAGIDEVESCTLTLWVLGSIDTVQTPVVDSEFLNAPFFLFQWVVGSSTVVNLDTGSSIGPYVLAGGTTGGPGDSYFNQTSVGEGNFPSYAIAAGPCGCDTMVCGIDAVPRENETDNGFFGIVPYDTTNGGCLSEAIGPDFLTTPIALGDKVCGRSATTILGRDTDWYAFTLTEKRTITVRTVAAFDMDVNIFAAAPDMCFGGFDYISLGVTPRCTVSTDTVVLYPGPYIIFCAPAGNQAVGPGSDEYQLELIDVGGCGHPVYDADAVPREVEPECDAAKDPVNGGCNSAGFPTTPIALGEKLRGTIFTDDGFGDSDWYLFTVTRSTLVACTVQAEFAFQFAIYRGLAPVFCDDNRTVMIDGAGACGAESLHMPVPPGTYVVVITAQDFEDVPCGSRYQLALTGEAIDCPGDVNLDGATNAADFNILASNFRAGPDALWGEGDLTGDGFVNAADFNVLASSFRCVGK